MNNFLFRVGTKTTGFLRSSQFIRSYGVKQDRKLEEIRKQLNDNPCVLYMKGTPERPECGFSNTAVRILEAEGAVYASFNVLKDENLREAIKVFGDWPTIPQLYVQGELVGGADVLMSLYKSGELTEILNNAKVLAKKEE
ncbi:hypothetical protein RB653_002039 [Dictyostelium firmibasis]|uniref:Glutaredoxin domain-containing protein n=1 Tax=Dictyostelium firmibasis TaxID=79012 RepID=A0AAN7YSA4_9MYCE